ncbi:expressed unknown protein [Seminavis robusta]|uniref:Uncharacterized protein n=1 Tax=Seminavis robusta TaxID=568900 RepID=A0A9N8DPP5_9STRA|nr:expressed unknown protein [Seminavis robusta]|eukprot:Sro265_g102880.1 n/a (97) ;mRNA; f:62811-63101
MTSQDRGGSIAESIADMGAGVRIVASEVWHLQRGSFTNRTSSDEEVVNQKEERSFLRVLTDAIYDSATRLLIINAELRVMESHLGGSHREEEPTRC